VQKLLVIQSAKILLLPQKYEIIIVPSNFSFFQYSDRLPLLFAKSFKSNNYMGSNTERSDEPIYKTHTKNEAKRLRVTTFAVSKLEERKMKG
jgi:hypothetical protein